jgi:hypothetical protein
VGEKVKLQMVRHESALPSLVRVCGLFRISQLSNLKTVNLKGFSQPAAAATVGVSVLSSFPAKRTSPRKEDYDSTKPNPFCRAQHFNGTVRSFVHGTRKRVKQEGTDCESVCGCRERESESF